MISSMAITRVRRYIYMSRYWIYGSIAILRDKMNVITCHLLLQAWACQSIMMRNASMSFNQYYGMLY